MCGIDPSYKPIIKNMFSEIDGLEKKNTNISCYQFDSQVQWPAIPCTSFHGDWRSKNTTGT